MGSEEQLAEIPQAAETQEQGDRGVGSNEITKLQEEIKAMKLQIESQKVAPKNTFSRYFFVFVLMGVTCAAFAHLIGEYHPKIVHLENRNMNQSHEIESLRHQVRLLRYMPQYGYLNRMDLGIERFFKDGDVQLYGTYEQWYRNLTSWMKNRKTYRAEKYMLVRKEFTKRHAQLFVSNENNKRDFGESFNAVTVDGFVGEMRHAAKVMVLHPSEETKHVDFMQIDQNSYYNTWMAASVPSDNYYGSKMSAIVLVLIK